MILTRKNISAGIFCLFACISFGQTFITSGKITFERKTNLMKRFKDPNTQRWLGEKNKTKTDVFELYFNDSLSVFKPTDDYVKDELSWATNKNTIYQNRNQDSRLSILSVWGESLYIQDSLVKRTWKMTENTRKIGEYECRKAIWEVNDSIRIYAWFSDAIIPSVGPETFTGLPGAILGLATEDGGVIYFAKKVEVMKPDFEKITPKIGKNKPLAEAEMRDKLEKQFGDKPEMRPFLEELFMW